MTRSAKRSSSKKLRARPSGGWKRREVSSSIARAAPAEPDCNRLLPAQSRCDNRRCPGVHDQAGQGPREIRWLEGMARILVAATPSYWVGNDDLDSLTARIMRKAIALEEKLVSSNPAHMHFRRLVPKILHRSVNASPVRDAWWSKRRDRRWVYRTRCTWGRASGSTCADAVIIKEVWWTLLDSNQWPHPCQGCALTGLS